MQEAVDEVLVRRRLEPDGLSRALSYSTGIHLTIVILLFVVPRSWFIREKPVPQIMTISLGGSFGERSGGMVSTGRRAVEEVAPPPKRPEPIPAATTPKTDVITVPAKTPTKTPPPKTTPKPAETPTAVTKPPTTGAVVVKGNASAETRSTVQNNGLTFGGSGAGDTQVTLDTNFCCPEYIAEFQRRILTKWEPYRMQPEVGTITVVFEILKDGSFTRPEVEKNKSTGSEMLWIASRAAFQDLKLQPLPKEYGEDRLKIHLTFPYVR